MSSNSKEALSPAAFGRVAVVMGGPSKEHDISLRSGGAVVEALNTAGVEAVPVIWNQDIIEPLRAVGADRVFNAVHGRGGEDGALQGLLEIMGLPYTGSGILASALGMDKATTKSVWRAAGIPTPESRLCQVDIADPQPLHAIDLDMLTADLGLPLFVKPARDGSSLGISRAETRPELENAILEAAKYDARVLVEQAISGAEYTVAILNDQTLPAIRLETDRPFYDFEAKYVGAQTRYITPAELDPVLEAEINRLALKAFRAVGAFGWGRLDLMVDAQQRPWFLEINTVPGMTDHSLVPMAAAAAGISFPELCVRILTSTAGRGR